jgi:hypothetical protein
MTTKTIDQAPLKTPAASEPATIAKKIAVAMEVRESSSKVREGKPLAFPTHRQRP